MKIAEHLGTIAQVHERVGAFGQALLDAASTRIAARDPDLVAVPSPREQLIWWGHSSRKADACLYMRVFRSHANLGFFHGVELPDPALRLEGTGKALRHLKIRDPRELDEPAVGALIDAAIARRTSAGKVD